MNKFAGLVCPGCGCRDIRDAITRGFVQTHTYKQPGWIKRRKVCRNCGRVIVTRESIIKSKK